MPLLSVRETVLFPFMDHSSCNSPPSLFLYCLLLHTSKPSPPTLLGRSVFCVSEPDVHIWKDLAVFKLHLQYNNKRKILVSKQNVMQVLRTSYWLNQVFASLLHCHTYKWTTLWPWQITFLLLCSSFLFKLDCTKTHMAVGFYAT